MSLSKSQQVQEFGSIFFYGKCALCNALKKQVLTNLFFFNSVGSKNFYTAFVPDYGECIELASIWRAALKAVKGAQARAIDLNQF